LPWTIKPLWGPLVDRYWTKRQWTIYMQLAVGIGFSAAALSLQSPYFFYLSLIPLFFVAFSAASHDIALDGFYMLALSDRMQAFFVGIRSTSFRVGMLAAQGMLPFIADVVQNRTGPPAVSVEIRAAPAGQEPISLKELTFPKIKPVEGEQGILVEPATIIVKPGVPEHFYARLNVKPSDNDPVVVVFSFQSGDRSTSLVEGARLVFDTKNWDQPTTVTVKADAKIKAPVVTELKALAGNIPLSWTIVVGMCGLAFFGFVALHSIVMPRPLADTNAATGQPSIFIPLFWLLVFLLVPCGLIYGLFASFEFVGVGAVLKKLLTVSEKGFAFFYTAGRWILVILVLVVIFSIKPVQGAFARFMKSTSDASGIGFAEVFSTFFVKKGVLIGLSFLLTFRLGEAQLSQMKNLFLLETTSGGGMGLSLSELAFANSVVYVGTLIVGGILGGIAISKLGLRGAMWPMIASMHLPNLLYVFMATTQPQSLIVINTCIGIESFGYGFGFTSFLFYMIYFAQGPYKTAHYALCTGFMALGMMIPGMWSGYLAQLVGYQTFFWLVMLFCLPGMLIIPFLRIDPEFGRGKKRHSAVT